MDSGGVSGQNTDAVLAASGDLHVQPGRREIFVIYASQDAAIADTVVRAFEGTGLKCWIAPRDVVPGALYADEIVRAINEAAAVVLILSEQAVASPHVGREIERASSKRRRIIVLRTDSAALTRALEYFLSESQWIDVGPGGIEAAGAKLVEAVRHYLHGTAAGEAGISADKPVPGQTKNLPRAKWIVVCAIAMAALALAYLTVDRF